ncbi:hypothetical protein GQ607_010976 [Colletotrichum asianum]|uniref:Uncharacterized protein n=1 Tax=Colletotrichum asianum TaxID=702518 RepID=A0A8H3WBX0_9PEZI|nr:hypothetical protein GQ607_010976 [Colletotrichum asianum]
MVSLSSKGL